MEEGGKEARKDGGEGREKGLRRREEGRLQD